MESAREHASKFHAAVRHVDDPNTPLGRLRDVALELASLHRELASLLGAQIKTHVQSWMNATEETTLKGRDRVAEFNTQDLDYEILQVKGAISAYQAEYEFLKFLIQVQG